MNRTYYNLDKLIKVELFDKNLAPHFEYRKARAGFLGIGKRPEGIYYYIAGFYDYLVGAIPDNLFIEDNVVYKRPYIVLHFQGGYTKERYFKNLNYAADFMRYIVSSVKKLENIDTLD